MIAGSNRGRGTFQARRLVPRAIIVTIIICCIVYVLVAGRRSEALRECNLLPSVAFVHLAPLASVNMNAPLATAFEARGATVLE